MPNKKNGLKKKNEMMSGYMGGGMMPKAPMNNMMPKAPMSSMYRKGGMLSYNKGGATEIGKESQSYKEYVKKMFDGGMTSPAMKKKLNYKDGGITKMQGGGHLLKENKRRYKKKELQAKLDENPRSTTTIGVRSKQRLDDKKPRGRKYSRSNAATKFAD